MRCFANVIVANFMEKLFLYFCNKISTFFSLLYIMLHFLYENSTKSNNIKMISVTLVASLCLFNTNKNITLTLTTSLRLYLLS